jgi:hypothetical protein
LLYVSKTAIPRHQKYSSYFSHNHDKILERNYLKEEGFILANVPEGSFHGSLALCAWAEYHHCKFVWHKRFYLMGTEWEVGITPNDLFPPASPYLPKFLQSPKIKSPAVDKHSKHETVGDISYSNRNINLTFHTALL